MAMTEKQKIGVGVGVVAVILLATMGTASAADPDFVGPDEPDDDEEPPQGDFGGYDEEPDAEDPDADLGKINLGDLPDPGSGDGGGGPAAPVDLGPLEQPESEADNLGHLNDLLDVLITPEPRVGRFYQIRQGDSLKNITQRALSAVHPAFNKGSNRTSLMQCMSASQWNRALYGVEGDFNSPNFPGWTSPDEISIRSAFFNEHQNAVAVLRDGNVPAPVGGNSYGLLWIPIIRANAAADITCIDVLQDDGSGNPGIEPPTIFKDLLVALGA